MNKDKKVTGWIAQIGLLGFLALVGCTEKKVESQPSESLLQQRVSGMMEMPAGDSTTSDFIQMSLEAMDLNFYLPAIQSPVTASYNGQWVLFGGRKYGLHSMDNDPPAFQNLQANDSIWVINMANNTSVGVPVPASYFRYLTASSQQYFQNGDLLYVNGGFTFSDSTSKVSNWTSDAFFEINLPNLIQYVTSNGASPTLDQVFTKFIRDPYLQVTGGEMIESNGNFYLVGGQNYKGAYIPGNTGEYTNSIRKFEISQAGNSWNISDTLTLRDSENLHRRDFNLAEVILPYTDSLGVVIYGGVFNKYGFGYQSPVYISGLASGNPAIQVDDSLKQEVNLYSAAKINSVLAFGEYRVSRIALLGGITFKAYDPDSSGLVIPDSTLALPFSNLMSSYYTNGEDETIELVQLPPNELLPGYLGTNAVFFPLPQLLYGNSSGIIDLNKVFPDPITGPVLVGYMYGGILSPVPNTFTADGAYNTRTNPVLYGIYMSIPMATVE
ncbi:MAG: hypothetical protein PSV36_14925 [Algoriphagus sp.]|nr:hypothetical protein [Algoriphagus sp.]